MKHVATVLTGVIFALAASSPGWAQITGGSISSVPVSSTLPGTHATGPGASDMTAPGSPSSSAPPASTMSASAMPAAAPRGLPALPGAPAPSGSSSQAPPSITPSSNGVTITIPGADPESGPGPEGPNIGLFEAAGVGEQPTGAAPGQVNSPGVTASVAGKLDTSDLTSLPPSGFASANQVGSGGQVAAEVNESEVIVQGGSQ